MKATIFLCLLPFCCLTMVYAQSVNGITGKRDTSFSNSSAYTSALKKHPGIKLVKEMPSSKVAEFRNIVYCSSAERTLELDAFIPKKSKGRTPAVLVIHGGGWRSGDRSQHVPMAQRLAEAGYASFTASYSLSTFALYPAAIYDLKAALRWMRANADKYNLDTTKFAVAGFSAGGELAAFLGATEGNKKFEGTSCNLSRSSSVQAVIDIDGILSFVHPESGEGDDSRGISAATHWFGYAKKDNPAIWTEASSLTHAANNKAPVLFLNSSVDRMHAGREDFRKVLAENNIYSEVHTFVDAPHTFCLFEPWFEPTIGHIIKFLNRVFK